jgi:hypothetical protein
MVGSMNVEVTVDALTSANETRVNACDPAWLRRVRCWIMTLLAQTRLRNFEKLFVSGAV